MLYVWYVGLGWDTAWSRKGLMGSDEGRHAQEGCIDPPPLVAAVVLTSNDVLAYTHSQGATVQYVKTFITIIVAPCSK